MSNSIESKRVLDKQERASLIESIASQVNGLNAKQIDDIFNTVKHRIAFLAVQRTEVPELQFSY